MGDYGFTIKVTNATNEELIVYLGVFPPQDNNPEFIEYYLIGKLSPGKTVTSSPAPDLSLPKFMVIAEKNVGQELHNADVLSASNLENSAVVFHQIYREESFKGTPHITITESVG